jgi:CheY-like chemotaxis protein
VIIALVSDLLFESRITATAAQTGAMVRVVRSAESVRRSLAKASALLIDLHASVCDPLALIGQIKRKRPGLPVIGYFSHVDRERKRRARDAGADEVLPRSVFTERLAEVLVRYSLRAGRQNAQDAR